MRERKTTEVIVSKIGLIKKTSSGKVLCGISGRKTMANAALCKYIGN